MNKFVFFTVVAQLGLLILFHSDVVLKSVRELAAL